MNKKSLCVLLVVSIFVLPLAGCNAFQNQQAEECPYKDFIVVDVFDTVANYQGIQSGWFGNIVKKKFNMELNIIAPNIASGGDTLYEMRTASGNLGDLIISGTENGNLQDLVDDGLIIDMSSLLESKDILKNYEQAIGSLNDKLSQDGIYAIPSEISTLPPDTPSEGIELIYGPYVRWDLYASIGYPSIPTLEDLLPVLKEMQSVMPYTESGNPTYAFSFFKDWDGNMMTAAKQPACLYGYDEVGFVLAKADGSDYQSILDKDSFYMRVLKFYFDANQLGLVDRDSPVQSFDDVSKKYDEGAILYSPWSYLGQPKYNTTEHKEQGKGYMIAPIDDMKILSYGSNNEGKQNIVISIGSQAKDPGRLADFIDWLYSPEGIQIGCSNNSGTAGPKGLTWEMGDNGPYLTDFGVDALLGSGAQVPEEWGGGTYKSGVSQLNYYPITPNNLDPEGYPYYYTLWDFVINREESPLSLDWKNHMGANSTREYLEKNNQIIVAPGCGYFVPDVSSEITTMRNQCRSVIVDYSWKMVFAPDETEFYSLMDELLKEAESLGYSDVLQVDMEHAKEQDEARKEAVALYGKK